MSVKVSKTSGIGGRDAVPEPGCRSRWRQRSPRLDWWVICNVNNQGFTCSMSVYKERSSLDHMLCSRIEKSHQAPNKIPLVIKIIPPFD